MNGRALATACTAAAACAVLLVPRPAPAQERDPAVFGEVLEVRVINIEVVVTDKQGLHVTGLGPESFRLVVDGKEVPIEYFSEILGGRAQAPAEPGGPEAPAVEPVPTVEPGGTVGTNYLLFIDNYFGLAGWRNRVLGKIQGDLPNLRPDDRMAVVAFDGHDLEMVSSWTKSQIELHRQLDRAKSAKAYGLQRVAEARLFDRQLRLPGASLIEESRNTVVEQYLRKLSTQVEGVVRAAATALRTFARPPGRKVMLLTSGGWPRDPVLYALGGDDMRYRTYYHAVGRAFDDLESTANLLGFTLYPIDMPGRRGQAADASVAGDERIPDLDVGIPLTAASPAPGGPAELPPTPSAAPQGLPTQDLITRENEAESALLELARETGGRALINAQSDLALAEAVQDTGSYYWLGFTPKRKRDDKVHDIKVVVDGKELEVRTRRSFTDLSRGTEVTMMVESNLLFASGISLTGFEVTLGTPKKRGRSRVELPLSLKIPLDPIVMLPGRKGYQADLELRVAVLDEDGNRSEIPVIPVKFGGPTEPPPGAHIIYDTSLIVRNARLRLVLALYDLVGEAILSRTLEFEPDQL